MNEKFRTAVDANIKNVRTVGDNLREAFFLHVQALVGAVQDDAQGMGPGGERAVEMQRFAQMGGVKPSRDEEVLAGVDREGFLGDGGDDLDAKRSELLGTTHLGATRGSDSQRLSKLCPKRRPSGQIGAVLLWCG